MNKLIGILIAILAVIGIIGAVIIINDVFDLSGKTIDEENAEIDEAFNNSSISEEEKIENTKAMKEAIDSIKSTKEKTD